MINDVDVDVDNDDVDVNDDAVNFINITVMLEYQLL